MEQTILKEFISKIAENNLNVLSVVIRKNNELIAEHHFQEPEPRLLWSVSKTFTSMAIGIAVKEGHLQLTDPVTKFFEDEYPSIDQSFYDVTIHDLLRMCTGHEKCPMEQLIATNGPYDNIGELFFKEPLQYKPGTKFVYNNAASYVLSKIISKTTGVSLNNYLNSKVYKPMGVNKPYWEEDVNGISFGCSGLYMAAKELSKFGQLFLNNGYWEGTELVPQDYIDKATQVQKDTSDYDIFFATKDHKQGYGYQLWMNSYPNSYRMDGYKGQYVIIMPEQQAVITIVSDEEHMMSKILELTWDTLVDKV